MSSGSSVSSVVQIDPRALRKFDQKSNAPRQEIQIDLHPKSPAIPPPIKICCAAVITEAHHRASLTEGRTMRHGDTKTQRRDKARESATSPSSSRRLRVSGAPPSAIFRKTNPPQSGDPAHPVTKCYKKLQQIARLLERVMNFRQFRRTGIST